MSDEDSASSTVITSDLYACGLITNHLATVFWLLSGMASSLISRMAITNDLPLQRLSQMASSFNSSSTRSECESQRNITDEMELELGNANQQRKEVMHKKFTIIALIAIALAACGQTKTQDYYLAHPDELSADLASCKGGGLSTYNCNEADKASYVMSTRKKE